ncbi:MAG: ATP-binding protein [Kiritimatiellaeota bacterium]|nr:ATP-binding protein [Kiritimatiellota bacterium]
MILEVNAAIASSLKMLVRLVGENIQLHFTQQPNAGYVLMDPGQMDQILANLVVNARDAISGTGHIAITVTPQTLQEADCRDRPDFIPPGNYVALRVRDDGAGMTPEIQARIFEPFFTTKEVGKGTGLGLATIYGIVKQNHGAITVESAPGLGTTFTIYLPRIGEAAPAAQPASVAPKLVGKETVLLVEDEVRVLELVQRILAQQGYKVLAAATPDAALHFCADLREPIHLLLTDVIMPGMGGLELAERLQKLWPGLRVLYMSGFTADVMEKHAHLAANVHVLQKPFTGTVLAQRVRAALDGAAPGTAEAR